MALTNKKGWLYFLGEIDFKSGHKFSYVKIGKTDYDRPVSDRSNDHQTGNPRLIIEVADSIRTNFIDTLETYMHHRFATKRVHGEWFLFDEDELGEAVNEAIRVNELLDSVLTEAQSVKEMNKSLSNGKIIAASKSVIADYEQYLLHETSRTLHKLNQDIVTAKLRKMTSSNSHLDGVSVLSLVPRKDKFDEAGFENKHPGVLAKFMKSEEKISRSYTIANKPSAAKSHKVVNSELKEIKSKHEEITAVSDSVVVRDSSIESLHNDWLGLHEMEVESKIIADIYSLRLQHACGDNEEIEGVCKWKRNMQTKESLDTDALIKAEPSNYQKFLVLQTDIAKYVVTKYRSY